MLNKVKFALCKTLAKHLSNKNKQKQNEATSQIKEKPAANKDDNKSKVVNFDNVFDLVFNSNSMNPKQDTQKTVTIKDNNSDKARLNFLGNGNLNITDRADKGEEFDLSKVKLSKQFKLINPLPKMKSVPATPEFFDIAGGYITYNQNGVDPEVESAKYEVQGGLFSAIGGFFGSK